MKNEILYASKKSLAKEIYSNFIIFKVEHKELISKLILGIIIAVSCLICNSISIRAKDTNNIIHALATVTDYNQDNGVITVEYNGQSHQFTSDSKYLDYAKEQYTELAQYKACTYIVVDSNNNIDEDTEAFNKDTKTVVD